MFASGSRILAGIGFTIVAVTATTLGTSPAFAGATGVVQVVRTTDGVVEISFTAAKGQTNQVVVTRSGRTTTFDDIVAVKAGRGCKAVRGDRTKVRCTTVRTAGAYVASLADRDDTFTNKTSVLSFVEGGTGNDTLNGGSGTDYLYGEAGKDRLHGNGGNDKLYGGAGNDTIRGGAGSDTIEGGAGSDNIAGGPGRDDVRG